MTHLTNPTYDSPRRRKSWQARAAAWFGRTLLILTISSVLAFLYLAAYAIWGLK